jgi:hypothetical protein
VAAANGIVGVSDIFQAETADTFEAGFKTRLFDDVLSFNGAVFTTKSKNSYFFVFLAANSTQNLGNVPETRIDGFELEAFVTPARDIQINAALGMTWSEIKEFPDPVVIGNEAPLISRSTFNLGFQWTPQLNDTPRWPAARRLPPHRRHLVGSLQHHRARSGQPGRRARRGRGRRLGRVRLRLEPVRRGIQRRVLAGRLRVQGAAAEFTGGGELRVLDAGPREPKPFRSAAKPMRVNVRLWWKADVQGYSLSGPRDMTTIQALLAFVGCSERRFLTLNPGRLYTAMVLRFSRANGGPETSGLCGGRSRPWVLSMGSGCPR